MKAQDVQVGDTFDGWTVTHRNVAIQVPRTDAALYVTPDTVLLTLEATYYLEGHDVNGDEIWWRSQPPNGQRTKTETRRTWYTADEEVPPL